MDNLKVSHTTYNIPIKTSIDYERKKRDYDENLLSDSGQVSGSVAQGNFHTQETHVDQLFGGGNPTWGKHAPPEGFGTQSDDLFGPHLTPICTTERLDAASSRIAGTKESMAQKPTPEISDFANNSNKIQSLIETIKTINQGLEYCYGERTRFQRG